MWLRYNDGPLQFDNEVDGFSLASSIACMDYNSPLELGKFVYNGVKGYYLSPGHDIMKVAKLVPKFLPFGGILEMYERKCVGTCPPCLDTCPRVGGSVFTLTSDR